LQAEQQLEEQEKEREKIELDRMAAEWDAKDRAEEEERRRKQTEADRDAAMREQRREQELYHVTPSLFLVFDAFFAADASSRTRSFLLAIGPSPTREARSTGAGAAATLRHGTGAAPRPTPNLSSSIRFQHRSSSSFLYR